MIVLDDSNIPKQRVNWRWILICVFFGIILILISFFLFNWQKVVLGVTTSGGVAFLLAAVLFFIERRFIKDVSIATDTRLAKQDERINVRLSEHDEQVAVRLDQLSARMDGLLKEREKNQEKIIQALDTPTYKTVADALAEAWLYEAIAFGYVTVQTSSSLDGISLKFSYVHDNGDGRQNVKAKDILKIEVPPHFKKSSGGVTPIVEVEWKMGDSVENVGTELRKKLESRGLLGNSVTFDWTIALQNLQRSLEIAIKSRCGYGKPGETIQGALFEFVTNEWAITDKGLECPSKDYVLEEKEFPEPYKMVIGPLMEKQRKREELKRKLEELKQAKPDFVNATLWDELLLRANKYFPIKKGPFSKVPRFIPLETGPT